MAKKKRHREEQPQEPQRSPLSGFTTISFIGTATPERPPVAELPDDALTSLQAATTAQLLDALMVRHRATLEQAGAHLTEAGQVAAIGEALSQALAKRVFGAAMKESSRYARGHPALRGDRAAFLSPFGPFGMFGPFGSGSDE